MTTFILWILFLQYCNILAQSNREVKTNPKAGLKISELVKSNGYPFESHKVRTEDDYIVTLHRIPYGKHRQSISYQKRPVAFLIHALLCDSSQWVMLGPQKGLAYLLADAGYDVWMTNGRGTLYSREHATKNPDTDPSYWNFSWHEIGYYDLPAMIDTVLKMTNNKKLYCVGHSQGSTTFFVMASSRPEYNDKIAVMVAFTPSAFLGHTPYKALRLITTMEVGVLENMIGGFEFLPSSEFVSFVGRKFCEAQVTTQDICDNILFVSAGFDPTTTEEPVIAMCMDYLPAGSSTRQFLHYGQLINSGHFRPYDYNLMENMVIYGRQTPPDYELSKISAPVALFYGTNDQIISEIDVQKLHDTLPNSVNKTAFSGYGHLDFAVAADVAQLVYKKVLQVFDEH